MIGSGSLLFNLAPYTKIPYEDSLTCFNKLLTSLKEEAKVNKRMFRAG